MTLLDRYLAAVNRGDIQDDPEQRRLLTALETVADALRKQYAWYRFLLPKPKILGLYIVGSVGIGKTYLLDLFYHELPGSHKLRSHFLHFMQKIDQQLRFLQGQRDPIQKIAKEFAKQYRVLCLDEFIVEDIAHAMILAELLEALFAYGVVLVATSNTQIDDLYRDGTNRQRFLPALALLHRYCDDISLVSTVDYRVGKSVALDAYLYPLNARHQAVLEEQFHTLAKDVVNGGEVEVQNRMVPAIKSSQDVIWFDFHVICGIPRSQLDYIELAERFHTIFVSNMPMLSGMSSDTAVVLLIRLVDVLYDRRIRLIISAEVPIQALYTSGPLLSEFARTQSRLEEMQSQAYLE